MKSHDEVGSMVMSTDGVEAHGKRWVPRRYLLGAAGGAALLLLVPAAVRAFRSDAGAQKAEVVARASDKPALRLHDVSLDALLLGLDEFGRAYSKATTTVQREQVRQDAQKYVQQSLAYSQIAITGTVTDVKASGEGLAAVYFTAPNTPGYSSMANPAILAMIRGRVEARMRREEALLIDPGQRISVVTRPTFKSHNRRAEDMINKPGTLACLTLAGDRGAIGSIMIDILSLCVDTPEEAIPPPPPVL